MYNLADYHIDQFVSSLFADTDAARKWKLIDEAKLVDASTKWLSEKVVILTTSTLESCVPSKKYWRMTGAQQNTRAAMDSYVVYLQTVVLDPIIRQTPKVPTQYKQSMMQSAARIFVDTWLAHFFDCKYRMSKYGCDVLVKNLESIEHRLQSQTDAMAHFSLEQHKTGIRSVYSAESAGVRAQLRVEIWTLDHPPTVYESRGARSRIRSLLTATRSGQEHRPTAAVESSAAIAKPSEHERAWSAKLRSALSAI